MPIAKVYTEGKTDKRYLIKAIERLKIPIDLDFYGEEHANGISDLLNICEILSKIELLPTPQIFIFDNDCPQYLNKISVKNNLFKYWGNNVYSFAIPAPPHRTNMSGNICMEYYFTDDEIKSIDNKGRRMFLSSEFDFRSGKFINNSNISIGNKNKLKDPSNPLNIKVIDSDVYDEKGNMALSKNDFSDYILNDIPPFNNFNYNNFHQIFTIINEIIKDFKPRKPAKVKDYEERIILKDHPPVIDIFVGREDIFKQLIIQRNFKLYYNITVKTRF